MIQYTQRPTSIRLLGSDSIFFGGVYSGHGEGLNNPALEGLRCVGPIPRGRWRISSWLDRHPSKGPVVAILRPDGWDALGRSGFMIHGDNSHGNFSASLGCIIAPRHVRELLRASGDLSLTVI